MTVNIPIDHTTPGSFHPLAPDTNVAQTNSDEFRGDRMTMVIIIPGQARMCSVPPSTSIVGRIVRAKMLTMSGITITAHMSNVPCHGFGL